MFESSYGEWRLASLYLFTGRRADYLDSGYLKIQYNRNRYYDYYSGRWLTHDPFGINPSGGLENPFSINDQYLDGLNLYEYVISNPIWNLDIYGTIGISPGPIILLPIVGFCDPTCRENPPVVYTVPDPIPASWRPPNAFQLGEVNPEFTVNISSSLTCPGACCRLKIDNCSCNINWWYFNVTRADIGRLRGAGIRTVRDRGGRLPEWHERVHIRQVQSFCWPDTLKEVERIVWSKGASCMCGKKADCYKEAIQMWVAAHLKGCKVRGLKFDKKVYPSGGLRRWADDLYEDAQREWVEFKANARTKEAECDSIPIFGE